MREIDKLVPTLVLEHVRQLGAVVVTERNAVASVNRLYAAATLGLGVLGCQVVKLKIEQLDRENSFPWLRFVKGRCLAYAVLVGGVPIRIQPENDEIRDLLPEERAAFRELREQLQLLPEANPSAVLRLEVLQPAGKDVESVSLYLFDEETGVTLDVESIYLKPADERRASTSGAQVIPFTRPAEDIGVKRHYIFDDEAGRSATEGDDERSE
jgi:hypothetical protein